LASPLAVRQEHQAIDRVGIALGCPAGARATDRVGIAAGCPTKRNKAYFLPGAYRFAAFGDVLRPGYFAGG
jgi:hypothetical protein